MRFPPAHIAISESVTENRNGATNRSALSSRKGLSQAESKAQTRAKLIAVGRDHFIRYGFSNTIADSIAKEAGFTRGALHSNFGSKEGLLLEVARESHKTIVAGFEEMIARYQGKKLVAKIREGIACAVQETNHLLILHFQIEAWRNKTLHSLLLQFEEEVSGASHMLLQKILDKNPSLYLPIDPWEFMIGLDSIRRGLSLKMVVSPSEVTQEQSRRVLFAFYDHFGFQIREKDRIRKR